MKKTIAMMLILVLALSLAGAAVAQTQKTSKPFRLPRVLSRVQATVVPTEEPTAEPTEEPTAEPTVEPTVEPTAPPTEEPVVEPTEEPTAAPTEEPVVEPTEEPTAAPTEEPTVEPTEEPTAAPTEEPTAAPTEEPTAEPTEEPLNIEAVVSIVNDNSALIVRKAPDENAEKVAKLHKGDRVTILAYEGDWARILFSDFREGYVFAAYLSTEPVEEPTVITVLRVQTDGLPLNYRLEPDGEIVGYLDDGTLVDVNEMGEQWTKIVLDGQIYYVVSEYLAPLEAEQPQEPAQEEMTVETLRDAVDKITIEIRADDVVLYGESVELVATIPQELSEAHLQWQQTDADGEWKDIPNANSSTTSVVITEQNVNSAWRVFVTVG